MGNGKTRVECVANKAGAHRRIICFEVVLRVPAQRRDAVTELQTEREQCARHAVCAGAQCGVANARCLAARISILETQQRWDDLVAAGSHSEAARKGLQRLEGKTYVVADGDVLNIRFNV